MSPNQTIASCNADTKARPEIAVSEGLESQTKHQKGDLQAGVLTHNARKVVEFRRGRKPNQPQRGWLYALIQCHHFRRIFDESCRVWGGGTAPPNQTKAPALI
jgi:hypothetical protein